MDMEPWRPCVCVSQREFGDIEFNSFDSSSRIYITGLDCVQPKGKIVNKTKKKTMITIKRSTTAQLTRHRMLAFDALFIFFFLFF